MTPPLDSDLAPEPDVSTLCFAPEESEHGFEKHPSASLLFDLGTQQIIAANAAAEALYGWTRRELRTMTLQDIRPRESLRDLQANLGRVERDAGSAWHRTVHWRRDGEPIEVEVLTQPMRLQGRRVWRAMVLDVTPQTRAEALFRGVAEQSLTGIYVIQDDRFVYLNPRLAEMFGYTKEQVESTCDPLSLLGPEARALVNRRSKARLQGDSAPVRYEVRAKRRDGSPIIVEVHGSSLTMRGRPALLGTVLDVTERVAAAATLSDSERRFRAAFEQSMTGMALTAPDGRWIRVNRALCDMVGYSSDEMAELTFQAMTHPDDLEGNLALRDALMSGSIPGYRMDKRFVHKSGATVWASLNVSVVRDESGQPMYMVAQMTDVTAQKRAEAALGDSEARLRQAQKMEAVGRLAGGVAHDFNNLLTVIGSNAEIGAALVREGTSPCEEFAEITAAVERAAALTRQLLAFSRRQVLAPSAISLNAVVRDAERMLRRVIGEDVVLQTRLDDDVGEVVVDRGQLEQVLMNLVVNARDAMPDGGRVVISTERVADGVVAVAVADTGSGMDAPTQARAFEPFFTTKELGKGTGLGLSTVYGIAQQSGGDVDIRSAPGAGTTVTLTLPERSEALDLPPAVALVGPAAAPSLIQESPTILLVEDEAGVRAVARRILARFGYRVVEATNGAEAVSLWREHRAVVRLVLTDAVMPVMGGRELADRLRAEGAEVPVLFMSGYADGERGGDMPQGAELIAKPFSAEQLGERVSRMLVPAVPRVRASAAPDDLPPG